MSTNDDRQPWDRQPEETDKAFAAFQIYRDAGPDRSQAMVADEIGHKSLRYVGEWSRKFDWVERVEQYVRHVDQERQRRFIEQRSEGYEILHDHVAGAAMALVKQAIEEGNIRAAIDILDRCSVKGDDTQRIEIGSADKGHDKLDELLPQVGQDRREDDGDSGAD